MAAKGLLQNYCGLAYQSQMLLLENKLRCGRHPYRWCYIKPGTETADDHVGLGEAELHLWAQKMYDGLADPLGGVPPNCFSWWQPQAQQTLKYDSIIGKKTVSDYDDNTEALLLESIFTTLDEKYPQSKFSQHKDRLYQEGIIYAVNALHFGPTYYMSLGMKEGSVGVFLEEVRRSVVSDERERARVARELSVAMSVEI
ncbi:hypothetical protein BJ165DRAFT_1529251 [Panaeolus papilionaceus]|nr:hypothetical protein BJ165DRAFT_1529251 [Panaeolus papilionaceus]